MSRTNAEAEAREQLRPSFARFSPGALAAYYRRELATSLALNLAYRGAVAIWVLSVVIEPLVLIAVWRTVTGSGSTGSYTTHQFVAYYLVLMVVGHLTFIWHMWEFESRIRTGAFSPLLLRPVHPIHHDVCQTLTYKMVGLVGLLPAAVLLAVAFDADFSGTTSASVLSFLPALVLAMALRFLVEWCLALAAFWLTKVSALNAVYASVFAFLAGQFAPLEVLPAWLQAVAVWTPFPWMLAFPVEVLLGRRTGSDLVVGYVAGLAWILLTCLVLRLLWSRATPSLQRGGDLMHSLRVLRAFLSVGVLNIVQYRSDFAIAVLNAVVGLATQLLGLSVVFAHTPDLHGWTREALLVLIGIHFFISGVVGVVVRPSMEALMEGIRLGTFDFLLSKPADAQLLASVQRVAPQAVADVALGIGVVVVGVTRTGLSVGPREVVLFAITILAGLSIVYGFLMLLSTLAFWLVRLDNILVIFQSLFGSAGRWPVTIFPGWMRSVLTFVVPIAFAVTVPAQALSGQLSNGNVVLSLAVAALFLISARLFWLVALRRYTGASA